VTLDILLAASAAAAFWGALQHLRRSARVEEPATGPAPELLLRDPSLPLDVGVGVAVAVVAWLLPGVSLLMAVPAGCLVGALVHQVQAAQQARRVEQLEVALAEVLDLVVGTLRAGGGIVDGLGRASAEAPVRVRELFRELLERIRLGDDPPQAIADLPEAVPLPSYRAFAFTLQAYWESGGGLADTLSGVARSIRERVAVARRVRTQSLETQVSALAVLVITYGLAVLMWRSDPVRMENFLSSEIGQLASGMAILLQALGLLWIHGLTRIEV